MKDPFFYTVLIFTIIGIIFIVLGIPLKQGKIPPNRWYGFRTRKTLSNDEIWYRVNRVTGNDMIRAGAILTVSSLILLVFRNSLRAETAIAILIAVMLLTVAWMAFHGISILREL